MKHLSGKTIKKYLVPSVPSDPWCFFSHSCFSYPRGFGNNYEISSTPTNLLVPVPSGILFRMSVNFLLSPIVSSVTSQAYRKLLNLGNTGKH